MHDTDDGQWILADETLEISGPLYWIPAFTCQPVTHRSRPLPACTAACRAPLAEPVSRLIFTPWVFASPTRRLDA